MSNKPRLRRRLPNTVSLAQGRARSSVQAGFTLIELLVVCAIIGLIMAITLVTNSRFGGAMQLENLAYELSLSVRQAQVYGIAVARSTSNTYSAGYGVHFDMSAPGNYIFFNDTVTQDGMYNSGELVQTNTLPIGYTIKSLCAVVNNVPTCGNKLDILFKRPEPDAWISLNGVNCVGDGGICADSATITLQSPRADQINVVVYANGQISVTK